jgi:hypothetical protein
VWSAEWTGPKTFSGPHGRSLESGCGRELELTPHVSLRQRDHPGINPDLAGAGLSTVMDPCSTTDPETQDIAATGYTYL